MNKKNLGLIALFILLPTLLSGLFDRWIHNACCCRQGRRARRTRPCPISA